MPLSHLHHLLAKHSRVLHSFSILSLFWTKPSWHTYEYIPSTRAKHHTFGWKATLTHRLYRSSFTAARICVWGGWRRQQLSNMFSVWPNLLQLLAFFVTGLLKRHFIYEVLLLSPWLQSSPRLPPFGPSKCWSFMFNFSWPPKRKMITWWYLFRSIHFVLYSYIE